MIVYVRVYTALTRGVHSPEFIADSLRKGNTPKGIYHDVYCSYCGHLTAFRNIFGEEGGAPHISVATVCSPDVSPLVESH